MASSSKPKVEFRRDERAPTPPEEHLNWSVQIALDHQMTLGELRDAVAAILAADAPESAIVQVNGNLVYAWHRNVLPRAGWALRG